MAPLALLFVLALPVSQAGAAFTAKVVAIHDGDTISVLRNGHDRVRIRLAGIDCPELHQDFGRRAKELTARLVFGRVVSVMPVDTDAYGRLVARVACDGQDLSLALVRVGMAWHYKKHSSDRALANAERDARAARVGLWSQRNPVPPWRWRFQNPHR
jgi:endonuclease YncB( thermonuclease family)